MIRRDYIMRLVQEMAQVLARVVSLKQRREYEQALSEVKGALRRIGAAAANEYSLEEWISVCRKHEQAASGLMVAVADLIQEQCEMEAIQNNAVACHQPSALALGLYLEALLDKDTLVSAELVGKVGRLIERTAGAAFPVGVCRRLVDYFSIRGQFAKAEDTLFAWLETGDPGAVIEGVGFYERLMGLPDDELERGDLPRSEVEQGRREFDQASQTASAS